TDYRKVLTPLIDAMPEARNSWYGCCAAFVEDALQGNSFITNTFLSGKAELTLRVYQSIIVCDFIRERGYIPSVLAEDVLTWLDKQICNSSDGSLVEIIRKEIRKGLGSSNEPYLLGFYREIASHLGYGDNLTVRLAIAQSHVEFPQLLRKAAA